METSTLNHLHDLVKVIEQAHDKGLMEPKKKRTLKKCVVAGCTSGARSRGLCKAHGGGKRCGTEGCNLSDQGGGFCIRHGGGKRCEYEGCDKSAQSKRFCKAHGGGVRCDVAGCLKSSQGGGKCRAHGGGPKWMRGISSASSTGSVSDIGEDQPRQHAQAQTQLTGSETPPPRSLPVLNPRLPLTVIEKIRSRNTKALETMSPMKKEAVPSLKASTEGTLRFTLPPLAVALQEKQPGFQYESQSQSQSQLACIYPTCKLDATRMGFCAFHSSQFCCQVAGCVDKRLRGATLCASHHASSTLARCLLHLSPDQA